MCASSSLLSVPAQETTGEKKTADSDVVVCKFTNYIMLESALQAASTVYQVAGSSQQ
jgi:hypothetical protein